jgi:hypothetical protein
MKRVVVTEKRMSLPAMRSVSHRPSAPPPAAAPRRRDVDASDLERIDVLTALLLTLNDPRASALSVAKHVQDLEVLAARIEERFRQRSTGQPPKLIEQIALLGNRELETILLGLLEDVVALHSEIHDPIRGAGE